jgi:hypothetical protein
VPATQLPWDLIEASLAAKFERQDRAILQDRLLNHRSN